MPTFRDYSVKVKGREAGVIQLVKFDSLADALAHLNGNEARAAAYIARGINSAAAQRARQTVKAPAVLARKLLNELKTRKDMTGEEREAMKSEVMDLLAQV